MSRSFPLATPLVALLVLAACGGETAPPAAPAAPASPVAAPGDASFATLDFSTLPADFPAAMTQIRASQTWDLHRAASKSGANAAGDPRATLTLEMNRELLEQSYTLGCDFLVKWQKPEGNFRYMYDWMDKTWVEDDHQVRQAGSLWGIGTCYRYRPTEAARAALDKGLAFWFANTVPGTAPGSLTMKYPGEDAIHSGTIALVALALVEYLATDAPMEEARKAELNAKLDGYLTFLQSMQRNNGHISDEYDHVRSRRRERSSPYYDGESLLALSKAARELNRVALVPTIEKAARAMAETYTVRAWGKDRDSKDTKGFYQWGSMAFVEYSLAGWKDKELFEDTALALGWWMTHTHASLGRQRNHAYAVEGLISAWRIAHARGDVPAQTDLLFTLDRSLHKLSQWQIGGPLAGKNALLKKQAPTDEMAIGGVMNAAKPSGVEVSKDVSHQLRIDVTQHQMHSVTLALENVYLPVP